MNKKNDLLFHQFWY